MACVSSFRAAVTLDPGCPTSNFFLAKVLWDIYPDEEGNEACLSALIQVRLAFITRNAHIYQLCSRVCKNPLFLPSPFFTMNHLKCPLFIYPTLKYNYNYCHVSIIFVSFLIFLHAKAKWFCAPCTRSSNVIAY